MIMYDECPEEEVVVDPIDLEELSEKQKNLLSYILDAKKAAVELKYPKECLDQLDICKTKIEVNNVMSTYRRRIR